MCFPQPLLLSRYLSLQMVWSFGNNEESALGRKGNRQVAAPVQGLNGKRVEQAVCGDTFSAFLVDNGQVYFTGYFQVCALGVRTHVR